MIGETEKIIIGGFKFEKVDGIRTIQSVFIQDAKDGDCIEVPVLNDAGINKEKLAKELLEYYRKEVVVIVDIKNNINRPNSNYVDLGFVGIKDI
ncbi:MAG: hypothetical protein IMZ60_01965 [Actinobacteria bacterium]|nr:hypothetical protein [Chloroflexota bacterium]MBE3128424.1 hypothetical protein [Actinomycetota bacterium]